MRRLRRTDATSTEEGKLTQQEMESFLKVTNASEDIKARKTEQPGKHGRRSWKEEGGVGGLGNLYRLKERETAAYTPLSNACGMISYAPTQCLRQSG